MCKKGLTIFKNNLYLRNIKAYEGVQVLLFLFLVSALVVLESSLRRTLVLFTVISNALDFSDIL